MLRELVCAAMMAVLSGCGEPILCGPCPGNRVELTAHHSIVRSGHTYELCDARGLCREGAAVVSDPSGSFAPARRTGTPAEAQVFVINLPGEATDYSRMPVRALVKDGNERVVGRGEAVFPEYRPIKAEPCYCYNAFVQMDVHPGS